MKELVVDMSSVLDLHNKLMSDLGKSYVTCTSTSAYTTIDRAPYHHNIIYIHKTNCPNCGGLLDGDEHSPYVKCACCGAKIWSEREVS